MENTVDTSQFALPVENFTKEFAQCWSAACAHIQLQARLGDYCDPPPKGKFRWHKAELQPPFLEHLSFSLGNQHYFVQLSDMDGQLQIPGSKDGLLRIADGWSGHPCFMPMRIENGIWRPSRSGWGLIHAKTGEAIDPPGLMTNLAIELTGWELHDFAISVVCDNLRNQGRSIMSWSNDPDVSPSLWFIGDDGPEWVFVLASMHPQTRKKPHYNMEEIALACSRIPNKGHFAHVIFNNIDDKTKPLYREQGANFEYAGLADFAGRPRHGDHEIQFNAMPEAIYTIRETQETVCDDFSPFVMMGAVIGDIAGSGYEGKYIKELPDLLITERDRFTDDSVMTCAVAEGIIVGLSEVNRAKLPHDPASQKAVEYEIAATVKKFAKRYPQAGYGSLFKQWVADDSDRPYNSYGNGSAMRVSYAGWYAKSLEEAQLLAKLSAQITHNHPQAIEGAIVVASCIYMLKTGAGKKEVEIFARRFYNLDFTLDAIRPIHRFNIACAGTVPVAIAAFLESDSFENMIKLAISLGGDTDTIAAIAGSIGEAFYIIPHELKQRAYEKLDYRLILTFEYSTQLLHDELAQWKTYRSQYAKKLIYGRNQESQL
jgi:ADP-ribosylglycohydrolase